MSHLSQQFPTLYRHLLPHIMTLEVPAEEKANCANCSMAQKDPTLGAVQKHLFRPDTKCCTYHPRLPNYLIGGLLQDERPALAEGQRRVRACIDSHQGVTPWWISPSVLQQHLYSHAQGSFGKAARLRCPYFELESGNCTIWAYREAVCSTWFCKYEAGKDGLNFWSSIKRYMGFVEKQLSRYAMLQIDPEMVLDDKVAAFYDADALTPEQLDERPPLADLYTRLWRQYEGREEAFYRQCYEIIAGLTSADVERLLGFDGQLKSLDVERKFAQASTTALPERLIFNSDAMIRWLENGEIALSAYSEYDAIALPGAIYPLLVAFDGSQSTEATRLKLRQEHQADISEEILLTLYRYRILDQA